MTDIYKCENCGKTFDEFEMNYRDAQIDKLCWCQECREKLPDKLMQCPKWINNKCSIDLCDQKCELDSGYYCPACIPYELEWNCSHPEHCPSCRERLDCKQSTVNPEPQSQLYHLPNGIERKILEGHTWHIVTAAKPIDIDALAKAMATNMDFDFIKLKDGKIIGALASSMIPLFKQAITEYMEELK